MRKNWFPIFLTFCLLSGQMALTTYSTVFAQKTQRGLAGASVRTQHNLKVFDTVWRLVNEKYYDPKFNRVQWPEHRAQFRPQAAAAVDETELYRIINRMLGDLDDRHTFAQSPELVRDEKRRARVGIGFSFRPIENQLVVTRVIGGSAAMDAGIKPGWILTERDDEPVDLNKPFLAQDGQSVRLKFLDVQDQVKKIQVICRPYALTPEQKTLSLEGGIAYIRFGEFGPETGKWFTERVDQHRQAPAIIIDLRGNSGGLLDVLVECLSCFYQKDTVFGEFAQRSGKQVRLRVPGRGSRAYQGNVAVLIDGESASAAEMLASAIQESGRGKIVGRRSAGAVLASIEEELPDGGRLQLSIRDYATAGKNRLEGHGVQPDEPVALSLADVRRNLDRDLEMAKNLLK
ncbi:MAG: hypothetical protein K1Y36_03130 [Blastocatellia bacterium]|nr:hypothetical protein [Blastocatellia bacterium]